ncbi:MAG: AMP-binding protein [Caulobacterales bacterium]
MTSFQEARDFLLRWRADYAKAYAEFLWPDPAPFNWALDWFDAELAANPQSRDRTALWIREASGGETQLSFAELSRRSSQAANFLAGAGVARGERVLLLLPNVAPLWEIMLAAMKLGAVVIPASTLLTGGELADRLARGKVRHVVAAQDQVGKFAGLATAGVGLIQVGGAATAGWRAYDLADQSETFTPDAPTGPDEPLLLYFTSGTTAKPKLVTHSHRSYPVGHLSTMYWIGLQPGDLHLNVSSPGWAKHAWSCVFAPWIAGAGVFVLNQPRFDARALLDALREARVTTLCAPPTVWRMLVQQPLADWRLALREVVSAGEPLNPEIIDQVRAAWGLTIRDGFGQTETTAQVGNPPGQTLKPGAMGRPLPGYRVTLLDAGGAPAVSEGEVCLPARGPDRPAGLMAGYEDADGGGSGVDGEHYHTGDIVTRDADGYLTFVGRADDVFKSSDYRISPFELESVLIEHPAVAEAAVVPSPDPLRLAAPKAYVSLAPGFEANAATALSILAYVRRTVAPYKRIRRIEIVEDLPKTISGKIRRVELRRQEDADGGAGRRPLAFSEEDFPELRSADVKNAATSGG